MKCLVTGGAGFIGSHVVNALIKKGADVSVIDNLSTGQIDNLNKDCDFIRADLADCSDAKLLKYLQGNDFIFHLAALPRIGPSFERPFEHHRANIDVTIRLLEKSAQVGTKKIVFSGSSAVYGDPSIVPTTENAKIQPLNPYALQKYTAEQYGLLLGKKSGVDFISLRYMNPYGANSFNPKNPDNAYSSVIGIFEHRIKNGLPLEVTSDGSQRRDFVDVRDVALANIAAALSDVKYGTFNVGTGLTYSIIEVAHMFGGRIKFLPARLGEATITQADISEIKSQIGWLPRFKIEDYINSIKQNNKDDDS